MENVHKPVITKQTELYFFGNVGIKCYSVLSSLLREADRFSLDAEVHEVGLGGRLVEGRHEVREVGRGVEWRRGWEEVRVGPESGLEVGGYLWPDYPRHCQ